MTNAERERINKLESIRTPQNSHVIDAAIADGRSPEQAALFIVNAGLAPIKSEEEKSIEEMVGYATEIMARNDPYFAAKMKLMNEHNQVGNVTGMSKYYPVHQAEDIQSYTSTGDELADLILAEINKLGSRSLR